MLGLWQNPAILWISGDETVKAVKELSPQRRLFAVARTINTASDSFSFRGIAKRADSADPLKVAVEIEAGWTHDFSWFLFRTTVSLYGVQYYLCTTSPDLGAEISALSP